MYSYQYSDDGGATWTMVSNHNVSGVTLGGLSSGTSYMFEVTSSAYGCESSSSSISFTTLESCDVPLNILISTTPQNATFSWDALPAAQSYEIVYGVSGGYWISETLTETSFTISHNQYGYVYLYVRSICSDDYVSAWSSLHLESIPSCELSLDLSSTDASCIDGDGTISASVSGAFGEYTLDFGGVDPLAVSAGTYTVTVTDDGGCSVSHDITVGQEDVADVSVSSSDDSFCSGSSVTLTASSGFSSYQWYDENGLIIDATSSTYSVTSGGDYYVVVTNSVGCSNTSDVEDIFEISLDAPTGLSVDNISTNTASLDWDATSPTGAYNVQYSDDGGATWTILDNYYVSAINLSNLQSGTTYMFEVTSSAYGCESTISSITFTTVEGCDTPINISQEVQGDEVMLSWDAVGNADSYEIIYNIGGQGWQSANTSTNTLSVPFSYGYSNSFYVRTICGDGLTSEWSALQSFTFSCDAPSNFVISEESGVVTFAWDDMGVEEYQIIYNAGSGWINEIVSGTSLQVSGVSPFYTVYAYLRSVCNSSSSFVSSWLFNSYTTSSGGRFANNNQFSLSVYPNPTNGLINVNIKVVEEDTYSIRLVDSFGKRVFEAIENFSFGEVSYPIDLTSFANGIYHLQIVHGEHVINERIIVQ